jgi:hypothetical protein
MSVVRISWQGELTDEQKDTLNDGFNLMGLYQTLERCELTAQERQHIEQEISELEAKLEI